MENDKKYLSLEETAREVGVGYSRLWYYLISGRLPEPARVGRSRVFNTGDVSAIRQFFQLLDGVPEGQDGPVNL